MRGFSLLRIAREEGRCMRYKRGTNQYAIKSHNWTLTEKILITMIISLCVGIYVDHHKPITLDPCGENGCIVHTVYAKTSEDIQPTTADIMAYIVKTWGNESNDVILQALQVAKHESGYRIDAKGYNCRYNGVSTACKPQDRAQAWSVDCGIFQHNTPGTTCPKMTWKENVDKAYKLWKRRAWDPWVVAHKLGFTK